MLAAVLKWNVLQKLGETFAPWHWALLLVILGVSCWFIFQLRAWFHEDSGRAEDSLELLKQFGELHRRGGLTEDEYRLIKGRLASNHVQQLQECQHAQRQAKTAVELLSNEQAVGSTNENDLESRSNAK